MDSRLDASHLVNVNGSLVVSSMVLGVDFLNEGKVISGTNSCETVKL